MCTKRVVGAQKREKTRFIPGPVELVAQAVLIYLNHLTVFYFILKILSQLNFYNKNRDTNISKEFKVEKTCDCKV